MSATAETPMLFVSKARLQQALEQWEIDRRTAGDYMTEAEVLSTPTDEIAASGADILWPLLGGEQ